MSTHECPHCGKSYTHYSSKVRHMATCSERDSDSDESVEVKRKCRPGYDAFGKISPYESETDMSDADDSSNVADGDDSDSDMVDKIQDSWKIIINETMEKVKESAPDCTEDNWLEEPCFTSYTLPSLHDCLTYHVELVCYIKQSDLYDELVKTATRLKKQGLPKWEANLKALEDRKHLVKTRLLGFQDTEDADDEDAVDE